MNLIKPLTLILTVLLFSGCAFMHSLDDNLPQQAEEWMQNKEYTRVINTLAYIHPGHPHYKSLTALREAALQKALQYETYILTRGKQLLDEQQWHQSYLIYEQGLQKLPDSAAIQQAMDELTTQRDTYIRKLSYQLLYNKSLMILANIPIQNKINTASQDNAHYLNQVKQQASEKDEVAVELLDCAEYSLHANQLITSQKCLELAGRLYPKPLPKRLLKLQEQLNKKRKSLSQQLSKSAQTNLTAARDALKNGKLKQAMDYLQKVPPEEQQKPAVIKLQTQLGKQIKLAVKKGAAIGRKLYSTGKIKAAMEKWQALQVLDPKNPALQKLIERAQRVLKKLESLGENKPASASKQRTTK